jgi:SAM-dependent methyltransferase
MARWMAGVARPSGRVVCIDIDDRFFALIEGHGIELIQGDVRVVPFGESALDFIHVRLLVEHLADREEVLARIVRWLKPGGWMVLVDSDYSFGHRTPGQMGALWSRVQEATADIVTARGSDFRLGMHLPRLMTHAGLWNVQAHGAFPLIVDPTTNGRFLQVCLELQQQLVSLEDVPAERFA